MRIRTLDSLKSLLLSQLDDEYNVKFEDRVLKLVEELIKRPTTYIELQQCQIAKIITALRKKTTSKPLRKKSKELVNYYKDLVNTEIFKDVGQQNSDASSVIPSSSLINHTNQELNSTVSHSTTSSLSADGSSEPAAPTQQAVHSGMTVVNQVKSPSLPFDGNKTAAVPQSTVVTFSGYLRKFSTPAPSPASVGKQSPNPDEHKKVEEPVLPCSIIQRPASNQEPQIQSADERLKGDGVQSSMSTQRHADTAGPTEAKPPIKDLITKLLSNLDQQYNVLNSEGALAVLHQLLQHPITAEDLKTAPLEKLVRRIAKRTAHAGLADAVKRLKKKCEKLVGTTNSASNVEPALLVPPTRSDLTESALVNPSHKPRADSQSKKRKISAVESTPVTYSHGEIPIKKTKISAVETTPAIPCPKPGEEDNQTIQPLNSSEKPEADIPLKVLQISAESKQKSKAEIQPKKSALSKNVPAETFSTTNENFLPPSQNLLKNKVSSQSNKNRLAVVETTKTDHRISDRVEQTVSDEVALLSSLLKTSEERPKRAVEISRTQLTSTSTADSEVLQQNVPENTEEVPKVPEEKRVATVDELTAELVSSLDEENNVTCAEKALSVVIKLLEIPLTLDDIYRTHLDMFVNDMRKKTSHRKLSKKGKELIRRFKSIADAKQALTSEPNAPATSPLPQQQLKQQQVEVFQQLQKVQHEENVPKMSKVSKERDAALVQEVSEIIRKRNMEQAGSELDKTKKQNEIQIPLPPTIRPPTPLDKPSKSKELQQNTNKRNIKSVEDVSLNPSKKRKLESQSIEQSNVRPSTVLAEDAQTLMVSNTSKDRVNSEPVQPNQLPLKKKKKVLSSVNLISENSNAASPAVSPALKNVLPEKPNQIKTQTDCPEMKAMQTQVATETNSSIHVLMERLTSNFDVVNKYVINAKDVLVILTELLEHPTTFAELQTTRLDTQIFQIRKNTASVELKTAAKMVLRKYEAIVDSSKNSGQVQPPKVQFSSATLPVSTKKPETPNALKNVCGSNGNVRAKTPVPVSKPSDTAQNLVREQPLKTVLSTSQLVSKKKPNTSNDRQDKPVVNFQSSSGVIRTKTPIPVDVQNEKNPLPSRPSESGKTRDDRLNSFKEESVLVKSKSFNMAFDTDREKKVSNGQEFSKDTNRMKKQMSLKTDTEPASSKIQPVPLIKSSSLKIPVTTDTTRRLSTKKPDTEPAAQQNFLKSNRVQDAGKSKSDRTEPVVTQHAPAISNKPFAAVGSSSTDPAVKLFIKKPVAASQPNLLKIDQKQDVDLEKTLAELQKSKKCSFESLAKKLLGSINDQYKILNARDAESALNQLLEYPTTIEDLKETGLDRNVFCLSKTASNVSIADKAKELLRKYVNILKESSNDSDDSDDEYDSDSCSYYSSDSSDDDDCSTRKPVPLITKKPMSTVVDVSKLDPSSEEYKKEYLRNPWAFLPLLEPEKIVWQDVEVPERKPVDPDDVDRMLTTRWSLMNGVYCSDNDSGWKDWTQSYSVPSLDKRSVILPYVNLF